MTMSLRPSPTGKQAQQLAPIWNSFDFTERKALAACSSKPFLDFEKIAFKQWSELSVRNKQELIKCALFAGLVSTR